VSSNPVEYAQNVFDEAYQYAQSERQPLRREAVRRAVIAYGLKGLAVFGGIAIASGLLQEHAQTIGLAITVAVAADGLSSNHVRMVLVAKAAEAYRQLGRQAKRDHQKALIPILEKMQKDPDSARSDLLTLLKTLTEKLHTGCEQIEKALSEKQIETLNALSLDPERSK
jgi:hypothetical protein